jgi:signal transduction histidine kinase
MSTLLPDLGLGNPSRPARILVAEDDLASAAVLRTMLQHTGYVVSVVTDGDAALRALDEDGPPDILLLDWMLPGVSGLEICRRVRERWDALAVPILMVTAKTDAESIYAAFDAGASDYVAKPFRGAELRARIAAHLRIQRLVEERRSLEEHLREREKLSALGLLASGVAHDLNNPLAAIRGYAQILLRGEEDGERAGDLRQILAEVERCRGIVGSLLGFVRRQPPERRPVQVEELLRSTLELRERALRAGGVRSGLALAPLPPVCVDANQLQQVFLNILLNAEQALRHGGSTLRAAARAEAGEVWLEFYNDAPPIPPEVLPRIFDPFFTTKSVEEGTGLGLAVSRRIVRDHGGDIAVESGPEGTTFRIRLPVAS